MVQAATVFGTTPAMSVFELKCDQIRKESRAFGHIEGRKEGREEGRREGREEGLIKGEVKGLLRYVKTMLGQPDEELTSLIQGIRDSRLIDVCYNRLEFGEVKTADQLKIVIKRG